MDDKKKVLLIEDSIGFVEIINRLLKPEFEVQNLVETSKGIQVCKSFQPDIILLDIMLSGNDYGLDFLQTLKRNEDLAHIPVILISSMSSNDIIEDGLRLGANDYLVKPFQLKNLVFKIKNLLFISEKNRERAVIEREIPFEISNSRASRIIEQLNKISDRSLNEAKDINIVEISEELNISHSTLNRILKSKLGVTAANYILKRKLEKARVLILSERGLPMKEIATSLGFNSLSYFSKCYKDQFGHTPSKTK